MKPWILVTGWTLIHFVWQGAVLALATAAALRLARRSSANTRYVIACAGLMAMLASPLLTAALLPSPETGPAPLAETAAPGSSTRVAVVSPPVSEANVPLQNSTTAAGIRLREWLPYIVWTWLAGVSLLMARFAGGCWRVRRLRSAFEAGGVSPWQSAGERIARRLGLDVAFRVVESTLVDAPGAIGWLRPVIVLPVAALANLAPAQIEAILAHELAHVRRRDYAVNLLQTLAETLLFYHPGVWWVSARVREEREHCCDDVAVGLCEEPAAYAAALAELASWKTRKAALAVGAADGSLLARIRRVMQVPHDDEPRSLSGLATVALAVLLLSGVAVQSSSQGERGAPAGAGSAAGTARQGGVNWRVRNTDHFELHYEADLDLHAERAGLEAERAYERVSTDLRHVLAFKVPVVLSRTTSELRQSTQSGRAAQPHRAPSAGPSQERILLAVDQPVDQWYGLLTHEVAHVFSFDIIPGTATPRWIMEGLAEYQREAWDPNDLVAVRDAVRAGSIPAIDTLDAGAGGLDDRLTHGLGHAAFDFIESRWGKQGVRQFVFGLRQSALKGGDPYETALRMPRDEFGRAFVQHLKERFAGSAGQAVLDRFDSSATLRIEGDIRTLSFPVSSGFACIELWGIEEGRRRTWALECGAQADPQLMRMLKPGDRVIVTGLPARKPITQRLMLRTLERASDGFTWRAQHAPGGGAG